jgi:hypothetical protein
MRMYLLRAGLSMGWRTRRAHLHWVNTLYG